MRLPKPIRGPFDPLKIINLDSNEIVAEVSYDEAQGLLAAKKVRPLYHHKRIYALGIVPEKPAGPEKPTPIRQHGSMGDSHNKLRECSCKECVENGKPIPKHEYRSTNPPKVWTIDALPKSGHRDWRTRAIFRKPILEAIYGRAKVEQCLNRPPETRRKAA